MIKLVIVDDEESHLEQLKMVFSEEDFAVAGAFSNPAVALQKIESLAPDVLITDIYMPEMSGLTLIEQVHGLLPDLPICALSVREDREIISKAILAGASGYLLKTETPSNLRGRLREVISDGAAFSPAAAAKVVAHLRSAKKEVEDSLSFRESEIPQSLTGGDCEDRLSKREMEVARMAAMGLRNKEIGVRLCISPLTARDHLYSIFIKLGVNNRTQLARALARNDQ